jgi:hypothetical protein
MLKVVKTIKEEENQRWLFVAGIYLDVGCYLEKTQFADESHFLWGNAHVQSHTGSDSFPQLN